MIGAYLILFVTSSVVLGLAGNVLVAALTRMAHRLRWKEFVAAFFIMSVAVSIPEMLIGVSSALRGIPELSFGNIVGANVIHFTLATALGALFLGGIDADSRLVQTSSIFTIIIAILPVILALDGEVSRADGLALIAFFLFYAVWLFAKKEHYTKVYQSSVHVANLQRKRVWYDIGVFAAGTALLLASTEGIIRSASFFADAFMLPLDVIGILIIGLGTALPETYFSIVSARNGNGWLIIGNLMGATVFTASFVLGIVALIRPIVIQELPAVVTARIFLIAAALLFFVFMKTGERISKREALILLSLYIGFVFIEMLIR